MTFSLSRLRAGRSSQLIKNIIVLVWADNRGGDLSGRCNSRAHGVPIARTHSETRQAGLPAQGLLPIRLPASRPVAGHAVAVGWNAAPGPSIRHHAEPPAIPGAPLTAARPRWIAQLTCRMGYHTSLFTVWSGTFQIQTAPVEPPQLNDLAVSLSRAECRTAFLHKEPSDNALIAIAHKKQASINGMLFKRIHMHRHHHPATRCRRKMC